MVISNTSLDGTTPDMCIVELGDGRRGVFKCIDVKHSIMMENQYEKVARFFRLPVSPCIEVDGGFVSIISYNRRYKQISSYDICESNTFNEYRKVLPESVYKRILLLAFVDAITNSGDRHSGNIAFLQNASGHIVDICPVYDNVVCLSGSYNNEALLVPDSDKLWTHAEVYKWLACNMENFKELYSRYNSIEFTNLIHTLPDGELMYNIRNEFNTIINI